MVGTGFWKCCSYDAAVNQGRARLPQKLQALLVPRILGMWMCPVALSLPLLFSPSFSTFFPVLLSLCCFGLADRHTGSQISWVGIYFKGRTFSVCINRCLHLVHQDICNAPRAGWGPRKPQPRNTCWLWLPRFPTGRWQKEESEAGVQVLVKVGWHKFSLPRVTVMAGVMIFHTCALPFAYQNIHTTDPERAELLQEAHGTLSPRRLHTVLTTCQTTLEESPEPMMGGRTLPLSGLLSTPSGLCLNLNITQTMGLRSDTLPNVASLNKSIFFYFPLLLIC